MRALFERVVERCLAAGPASAERAAVDGAGVLATASRHCLAEAASELPREDVSRGARAPRHPDRAIAQNRSPGGDPAADACGAVRRRARSAVRIPFGSARSLGIDGLRDLGHAEVSRRAAPAPEAGQTAAFPAPGWSAARSPAA